MIVLLGSAGAVVGTLDVIRKSESDQAAKVVDALLPEKVLVLGSFFVGSNGLNWQPSEGKWKLDTYVKSKWVARDDVLYQGQIDLYATDETWAIEGN